MTPAPTALVTGAGAGIGRRISLRLAEAGFEVCLSARSESALREVSEEIEAAGGRAHAITADLADVDSVERLAVLTDEVVGPLDLLVSNCGVTGPTAPLWEVEPGEWERTFAVNVTAPFLLCRGLLPAMIEHGGGSVVMLGSATGKRPLPTRSPYAASKTALIGLVRSLAWEVGKHGIRVNLVSPGPVEGERLQRVVEAQAAARGLEADAVREEMRSASALRRLTGPGDVAEVVLFLAGEAAAGVTGEDLNVSSGWVMHG